MPNTDVRHELRDLALLYLDMAHAADHFLSDVELKSVTDKLEARSATLQRDIVQEIVMESLEQYVNADDARALARQSIVALHDRLTPAQKSHVLEDLQQIARADGVLLQDERGLLTTLARHWGVVLHGDDSAAEACKARDEPWSVLHDLAVIYIHLAHATDHELNPQEVKVMVNKLQEWRPQAADAPVEGVLEAALEAYGRGDHDATFERAIVAVREALPHAQRMAALNDLIKIANADGVFLDDEEDMINSLLTAWDVEPYANSGGYGAK